VTTNKKRILYSNCILLTDSKSPPLKDAAMLVEDDTIEAVGKRKDLVEQYPGDEQYDLKGRLLMPGLVNTHTHLNMSILRGLAEDLPLQEWLDTTYQFRQDYLDDDTRQLGVRLSLAELLKNGVTTVGDMSFYQHRFLNLIEKSKIRALLYDTIMAEYMGSTRTEEIIDFIHGTYPDRICAGAALHAPYTTSVELMQWFKQEIIDKTSVPYCIHLAETKQETLDFQKEYNKTSTAWLNDYNFLSDRLLAVHCVWVTDNDIKLLSKNNSAISYNPESNMKLGSGIAPVEKFLDSNLQLGLGTDGAASNNDLDLFSEMDTAGKLQKVHNLDPQVINANQLVHMITTGGAQALGMEDKIGSLEAGKKADFITIDFNQAHLRPIYEVDSLLSYAVTGADVRGVWVGGEQVLKERKLLSIDEDKLLEDINKANYKINKLRQKQNPDQHPTI